ncbi:MAG: S9 family peptidase [Chthonomonadaceae bacterium]|nr:S9 family peptidase [Chthonomonadaceae bacterium]
MGIRYRRLSPLLAALLLATLALGTQGTKKPIDHDVYDTWRSIRGSELSRDGKWLVYAEAPQEGDGVLLIKSVSGDTVHKIDRGTAPRFTHDSRFVLTTIVPPKAEVDQAKKEKKKPAEMPKNALGIFNLATGELTRIERLKSLRVPSEDSGWIAYQVEPEAAKPEPKEPEKSEKPQKKKDHPVGSELIVRNVASGTETKFADVGDSVFSKDGKTLLYAVSTKTGEGDGLFAMNLEDGAKTTVADGMANYRQLTWHDDSQTLAFVTDRDDYKADPARYALYVWKRGSQPKRLAAEGSAGLPEGWILQTRGSLSFSDSGKRVFFPVAPKPEPEKKEDAPADDEKVVVDIWNWRDPELQPMQLLRAAAERNRTYTAMADLETGKLVQLETEDLPNVTVGGKGDGAWALGTSNLPYRQLTSWDTTYVDVVLVNVSDGSRRRILEQLDGQATLSPECRFVSWFDQATLAYYAMDVATGKIVVLSAGIPYAVHDEEHDTPDRPNAYGNAGWLKGDQGTLIYDAFDLWLCDPTGVAAPRCVTEGFGRRWNLRLRVVSLDRDRGPLDPKASLLLNAFNADTKAAGFYRDSLAGTDSPQKLVMEDRRFGNPSKAEDADVLLFTQETFRDFPDLWVSNGNFEHRKRMSDVNPQQAEYAWGDAELVQYTSIDGVPLQGILVKPADFDPGKKYPMLVYFYERLSDGLHRYYAPSPSSGASVNPSFYASRGYLVLMPDIPYKVGYPGESALHAILPAVQSVASRGYVDTAHMALCGHSWGGYQTAFLITRTNLFRCAIGGAVVSNMTSAYGGIRWGSGMVRQFQYEKTQSRIGGSLWERPLQYLENSPIFWADKVETPLLLIHNDADGAVPWYQGIEYFTALRRLGKPVWMLNYNGEDHGLGKRQNRKDWSIRMQQFFDFYLKDAAPPVWLVDGVPAVNKGKDLGLGLIEKKGGG